MWFSIVMLVYQRVGDPQFPNVSPRPFRTWANVSTSPAATDRWPGSWPIAPWPRLRRQLGGFWGVSTSFVNIQKNYGKSPLLMGKLTISIVIFNSYVKFVKNPICSMYGIFTYISVIFRANVGKYSSTMEHMGLDPSPNLPMIFLVRQKSPKKKAGYPYCFTGMNEKKTKVMLIGRGLMSVGG